MSAEPAGVETLARVYDADAFRDEVWADEERPAQVEHKEAALAWAEWHTRHPAPLLAALAEAGVLREVSEPMGYMRTPQRRYVTDWTVKS